MGQVARKCPSSFGVGSAPRLLTSAIPEASSPEVHFALRDARLNSARGLIDTKVLPIPWSNCFIPPPVAKFQLFEIRVEWRLEDFSV
jgi:hypothetical protein